MSIRPTPTSTTLLASSTTHSGIIRFQESRDFSLVAVIADPNRESRALEGAADLLIDSDIAPIIREQKTAKELKQLKADHVNEIAEIKKENESLRAELVPAVDERDELKAALTRRLEGVCGPSLAFLRLC